MVHLAFNGFTNFTGKFFNFSTTKIHTGIATAYIPEALLFCKGMILSPLPHIGSVTIGTIPLISTSILLVTFRTLFHKNNIDIKYS